MAVDLDQRMVHIKAQIAELDAKHQRGELSDLAWKALRRPFERQLIETLAAREPPGHRWPAWVPRAAQGAIFVVLFAAAIYVWMSRDNQPSRWSRPAQTPPQPASGPIIIYAPPLPDMASGSSR